MNDNRSIISTKSPVGADGLFAQKAAYLFVLLLLATNCWNIKFLFPILDWIPGLIAAWLLIPKFGVGGVVIAIVIYETMQIGFYYLYYIPKTMKLSSLRVFMNFVPSFILGALLFALLYFLPHIFGNLSNVFIYGGTFAIVFAVVSWMILGESDKSFIKGLLKSR